MSTADRDPRHCLTSSSHDVAPKTPFEKTFNRVYSLVDGVSPSPKVNPQEIALVFIILAHGTTYNIEMPNGDPSIDEWMHLSERALVKGEFLSNNMLAGVQTLVSRETTSAGLLLINPSI